MAKTSTQLASEWASQRDERPAGQAVVIEFSESWQNVFSFIICRPKAICFKPQQEWDEMRWESDIVPTRPALGRTTSKNVP